MQHFEFVTMFREKQDEGRSYLTKDEVTAPHKYRDLMVLNLIAELVPNQQYGGMISCAEHDQVWFAVSLEELALVINEEQVELLVRCGMFLDEDSLSMFV